MLLLLLGFGSLQAKTPVPDYRPHWERANDQYTRSNYDSAIVLYKQLIEMDLHSWEVYYNLGNSYYKQGKIAHAILNLERAHKLKPGNKDIRFNLEIANLSQQDQLIKAVPQNAFQRAWNRLIGLMPANGWTRLALLFFWLSLIGIGLYSFRTGSQQRLGFYSFIVLLGMGAITLILANSKNIQERNNRHAIIMAPSAVIKSEPNDGSTNLYLLREGFKLKLLEEVDEWHKIQLADGNIGWVLSQQIEEI